MCRFGLVPFSHLDKNRLHRSPVTIPTANWAEEEQRQQEFFSEGFGARSVTIETAALSTLEQSRRHRDEPRGRVLKKLAAIIAEFAANERVNIFQERVVHGGMPWPCPPG